MNLIENNLLVDLTTDDFVSVGGDVDKFCKVVCEVNNSNNNFLGYRFELHDIVNPHHVIQNDTNNFVISMRRPI
jgi:hypothetical protein